MKNLAYEAFLQDLKQELDNADYKASVELLNNDTAMLQYTGKPLKFCSYSDLELREHHWVAQTRTDEFGRTIQIWRVGEDYYACID